jgi:hypothetical protein
METQRTTQADGRVIEGQVLDRGETAIAQRGDLSVAAHRDPDAEVTYLERRAAAFDRLLAIAISATQPHHWFDQQGKPYLGAAGSEVVGRKLGVKWAGVQYTQSKFEDDKGEYYEWSVTATFSLPGGLDSIESIGTCSSRDNFLGTETRAGRELADVDIGNIRKAAYSNMIVNGVTRLLGIRGLTWQQLSQFGITADGATKVDYKTGNKGGGAPTGGDGGLTFKFGRCKGKGVFEVSADDLNWYLASFKKDLGDPEKAKYKANTEKQIAAVEHELARRANEKAGVGAKPAAGPSMWSRIITLADEYGFKRGEKDADLIALVKKTTDNKPGKDLDDADFVKVEAAMSAALQGDPAGDVPY